MRNKLFWLCLLLVTLKGIVWAAFVPLWHFPDEQAHFAQVSYLGEIFGYPPQDPESGITKDLSEEILMSERLLGTERENGINKFTYHPEYRIPYTDTTIGMHEEEIMSISHSARTMYIKHEAANYPALYYITETIPYRLFYEADLFTRAFATRVFNLTYILLFALVTWKISSFILPRQPFFAAALTLFVSFQPMFTFVSSGITSDNAINLWYAVFLLWGLTVLYKNFHWSTFIFGVLLIVLGPLVKQQSLFMTPLFFGLSIYFFSKKNQMIARHMKRILFIFTVVFFVVILFSFQKDSPVRAYCIRPAAFTRKHVVSPLDA